MIYLLALTAELVSSVPTFPGTVEPGMQLGPYEVLLCIARGGMARVWAARQHGARGFNRLVALKTVLPELAEPEFETMFLDEARVAARIHHPNVCEIFELIEHSGVLALSMEWIDGDTLNTLLNSTGQSSALDVRVAAQIVAHVASGLHAAHELSDESGTPMQLVHRDVSPQNILISRKGQVKVADFGVAKALGGSREATAVGKVKGKLSYMSPEQAQGRLLDRRSDIFSLGVVLYLATTGVHPFRRAGESREDLLLRLLTDEVTPPSQLVSNYPPELEAIVLGAMCHEVAQRCATADELRRQLEEWLVRSGPLISDRQIAELVFERVGPAMQRREERIQNCIRASRRERGLEALRLAAPAEATFVPTTTRTRREAETAAATPLRKNGWRVTSLCAALGLAVAATVLITNWGTSEPAPPSATAALSAALPDPTLALSPVNHPGIEREPPTAEPSSTLPNGSAPSLSALDGPAPRPRPRGPNFKAPPRPLSAERSGPARSAPVPRQRAAPPSTRRSREIGPLETDL